MTLKAQEELRDPGAQSFCEGALLVNYHGYSLRDSLLIKQPSNADGYSFQRP